MRLKIFEENFNKEYRFDELKNEAINNIKSVLENYENNFLINSVERLPKDVLFKDLKIEYCTTYIILNKEYGAKPSFRLIFNLICPQSEEELFTYEIEYNSDGEYSDEFFLDY